MTPATRRLARLLTRRPIARAVRLAGVGLLVAGWLALAPTAVGGSSTYVTTYGSSMEPVLHRGDLAMVRAQPSYQVGEIVAYRSTLLRTTVLHRIIGRDGERFVFKGDNNAAPDADRPTADALIGKMTMHVPGMGTNVERAASPAGLATLGTVAFFPVARRRRTRGTAEPGRHALGRIPSGGRRPWVHVEPWVLTASVIGVALLAVAFTRPPSIATSRDLPFDDRGTFTYSGSAPGGLAVYQSLEVPPGQPVFLNLVDRVQIGFAYEARAAALVTAAGDVRLRAVIRDTGGWTYPIELAPPTHFDGPTAEVHGELDLAALRSVIDEVQRSTGVSRDAYSVDIEATVDRAIERDGARSAGSFDARLQLTLDDHELFMTSPGDDALRPSQGGLLQVPATRTNELEVLGRSVSVAALRAAAIAIAGLLAALWVDRLSRAAHGDEIELIERRYRGHLLRVLDAAPPTGPVISLESMSQLVRLADHLGAPILTTEPGAYDVVDGDRRYRYSVTPATIREARG